MGSVDIGEFILYMVALIFSLSVHEAMHAWMSNRFGDDLAYHQGRISLNPASHVDPIGTLLFPAIAFFTHAPLLGWARPTPVNPLAWRNKRVANFWVSLAGILGNLAIAVVAGVAIVILLRAGAVVPGREDWITAAAEGDTTMRAVAALLEKFFMTNVALAVFNLLPIPPLDGSKVLASVLPESFAPGIEALEQFGFLLLFVALFTGVLNVVFNFVIPSAWLLVALGVRLIS